MARKSILLSLFFFAFLAVLGAQGYDPSAGQGSGRLRRGIELFASGSWGDAIVELRRAREEAVNTSLRAEAQFWIAMAEMSSMQYTDAIHDFDEILKIDPLSIRRFEVPYQKARAFYCLGRYNEAIVLFSQYADSIRVDGRYINGARADNWYAERDNTGALDDYNKKAAAIYWIGECLYNLEQFDKAAEMFNLVVNQYPRSHKYEAASNRLTLIKQKKIETQLLDILRAQSKNNGGSETGSVTLPQGADAGTQTNGIAGSAAVPAQTDGAASAYNDAVLAYKNSIAPFLIQNAVKDQYVPAPQQTLPPQAMPLPPGNQTQAMYPQQTQGGRTNSSADPNTMMRLLTIKTQALEMMDRLQTTLNAFENFQSERW